MIPTSQGRIALPLSLSIERELNQSDLFRLATEPVERSSPPSLQRLKTIHHIAARLLATGQSCSEVALVVNRTPQRIRDLQSDPAFAELVEYYSNQIADSVLDDSARIQKKLLVIVETTADAIIDRISDDEGLAQIGIGELRQLMGSAADRTVAPPKQAQSAIALPQQITFNIGGQTQPNRLPGDIAKLIDQTPEKAPSTQTE